MNVTAHGRLKSLAATAALVAALLAGHPITATDAHPCLVIDGKTIICVE